MYEIPIIKPLVRLLLKQKLRLFAGIFFMISYALATVAPVKYVKDVVDTLSEDSVPELVIFITWGGWILVLFALKGISYFGQTYLMGSLGQSIIRDLRYDLFFSTIRKPISFFNKNNTGDLINRFTTDLNTLNEAVRVSITGPLRDFPQIFFLLGLMAHRSWKLSLLTMALLPPSALLISKFGQQNKKVTTKRLNKFGELSSLLVESITGIRVVKAFSMENYEAERFKKENNRLYRYFVHSIKIGSYSFPVLEFIGGICGAAILIFGGYLMSHGEITSGDFASFILAFFMLNDPIKKFNGFTLKIHEGIAASQRIFSIIDEPVEIKKMDTAKELPLIKKEIKIEIKKFGYDERIILHDIQITLQSGTITALVGSSGSGKTTLANLIPRFYEIPKEDGSITIDGHDLREIKLESLRKQIAIVTQEIVLFNDTINNNISYGHTGCSEEAIRDAAKAGFAHEFIIDLPNGYDQQIGEKGVRLSGGQRQRISISRALIKNAPILILDEATSALDTESEKEVQAAIENLMRNRTTLVIAHRLSTIQHADTIHVLKEGQIVESGSHSALLAKGGEYKRLYELQFSTPR